MNVDVARQGQRHDIASIPSMTAPRLSARAAMRGADGDALPLCARQRSAKILFTSA